MTEAYGAVIRLADICEVCFNAKYPYARKMAAMHQLPVPVFKLGVSRRAPWMVRVTELAQWIDREADAAKRAWTPDLAVPTGRVGTPVLGTGGLEASSYQVSQKRATDWVGTKEIAAMCGLTREHVTKWLTKQPKFPAPVVNITRQTRRWDRAAVVAHLTALKRRVPRSRGP